MHRLCLNASRASLPVQHDGQFLCPVPGEAGALASACMSSRNRRKSSCVPGTREQQPIKDVTSCSTGNGNSKTVNKHSLIWLLNDLLRQTTADC